MIKWIFITILIVLFIALIVLVAIKGIVDHDTRSCVHFHTELQFKKAWYDPIDKVQHSVGKYPTEVCDEWVY